MKGIRLPAPGDPDAPKYWLHNTDGVLVPAVNRLIKGYPLSVADIGAIRAYLRQWIWSPVWDKNPTLDDAGAERLGAFRESLDRLATAPEINHWIRALVDEGMDPL